MFPFPAFFLPMHLPSKRERERESVLFCDLALPRQAEQQQCVSWIKYRNDKKGYIFHNLLPGNYTAQVRATSLAGNGSWTEPVYFKVHNPGNQVTTLGQCFYLLFYFCNFVRDFLDRVSLLPCTKP